MKPIIRRFIGGPLHNEMRAVDECSLSWMIPMPDSQRRVQDMPEWMAYQVQGDAAQSFESWRRKRRLGKTAGDTVRSRRSRPNDHN